MSKCIYCFQGDDKTTFVSREHVIPQSLGLFTPINPVIRGDVICDRCNREFSALETVFIEDTYEGVTSQRLDLQGRHSVTLRNDQFKIERDAGFGDTFFDQMFFFLSVEGDRIIPKLKSQFRMKRPQGGYRIFLPEALEKIKKDSAKFKRLRGDMKKLDSKGMCIFAETVEEKNKIILLLADYEVSYKERETKERKFVPGEKLTLNEDYECTISHELGRVFAKIAFNYFAYCAIQSQSKEILYLSEFDSIRNYIIKGQGKMQDVIVSIAEDPILELEHREQRRLLAHVIQFSVEGDKIVSKMTFFGRPAVYKVVIGSSPRNLSLVNFGCGHAFNPISREIFNLFQARPLVVRPLHLRVDFGFFRRFTPYLSEIIN